MFPRIMTMVFMLALLTGCMRPTPPATQPPAQPSPTISQATKPAVETPSPPPPSATTMPPAPTTAVPPVGATPAVEMTPQRVTFQAEDGTQLVGDYFPAAAANAPLVVLMHQMGSNRQIWVQKGLVDWLTNRQAYGQTPLQAASGGPDYPPLPTSASYAVFTFDFRGHGESQGQAAEPADYLSDAKAAIETARSLPGVDPNRIALLGASIGADAAVDACGEGCQGSFSLSPGDFLGQPYAGVVAEMSGAGLPVYCLAAQGDTQSAKTCQAADGGTYHRILYPGSAHGANLLISGFNPEIGGVILEWLQWVFEQ
jgi:hypothetical protein